MPLVDPVTTQGGSSENDWSNKLMGKKLGEQHDEITFAKQDLPEKHRVLGPNTVYTMDYRPERLNIHVDDDGTVKKVNHG